MKSNLNSLTFVLLLPLLFVHWVGDAASAAYVLILFTFALGFRIIDGKVPREVFRLFLLLASYLIAVTVFNHATGSDWRDFTPNGHLKLFYLATSIFLVTILLMMLPRLTQNQAAKIFGFYYWGILITIAGEWILVNMCGISNSLMPAYRDSPTYYEAYHGLYRPFGLTGNASVNGSMLVVATWIMALFVRPARTLFYWTLALVTLILNNSGQALLSFFITSAMYFAGRRKGIARIPVFAIGIALCGGIIYSAALSKLSLDYLLNVNQYWGFEIFKEMDVIHIIFGGYSFYNDVFMALDHQTEFYPVYAISRFGLLSTIATWIYLWSKLPIKGRLVLFVSLFIGSIHYPVIWHIPLLVLVAILMTIRSPASMSGPAAA